MRVQIYAPSRNVHKEKKRTDVSISIWRAGKRRASKARMTDVWAKPTTTYFVEGDTQSRHFHGRYGPGAARYCLERCSGPASSGGGYVKITRGHYAPNGGRGIPVAIAHGSTAFLGHFLNDRHVNSLPRLNVNISLSVLLYVIGRQKVARYRQRLTAELYIN